VGCAPRAAPFAPGANNSTWTDLSKATGFTDPSARYTAMMTYDPIDGYVLMFGGYGNSGSVADTWAFDNGTWSNLGASGPSARYIGGMTFDAADGYVLLFGGYSGSTYYNDTWSFVHGQWTQITSSVHAPSPRWRMVMAYDPVDKYVVLFGGTDSSGTPLSDTWTYVSGNWTDISSKVKGTPPGTYRAAGVWDDRDGYLVMFGGCTGSSCPTQNTYTYVGGNWTDRTSTDGKAPSARLYTQMAYDNATGYVLLLGGASTISGPVLNDTWAFENGTWYSQVANVSTAPPVRGYEMMAFDPSLGAVLLYGGYTETTILSDSWAFGPPVLVHLGAVPAAIEYGQSIQFTAAAYSNDLPLNLSYQGLPTGCASANSTSLSCTPSGLGVFEVNLTARDTHNRTGIASVTVQVATAPTLASFSAQPGQLTVGGLLNLNTSVNGGILPIHYQYLRLPRGCVSQNVPVLSCHPASTGTFTVEVIALDAFSFPVFGNTSFKVNPSAALVSFAASPAATDVNRTTILSVTVANGTGPFHYAYSGLPPGCSSTDATQLACTPTAVGNFTVGVGATDASGFVTRGSLTLSVNPDLGIAAFNTTAPIVDVGAPVGFAVTTSGGSGGLGFAYSNAPTGCTLPSSAQPTCTPTAAGNYTVQLTVTDLAGSSANASVTLVVVPQPTATLTATPSAVDATEPFNVALSVSNGIGPFKVTVTAPAGFCPNAAVSTGNFSCTAGSPGALTITEQVLDQDGKKAIANVTIAVVADPAVASIDVAPTSPVTGSPLTLTVNAQGGSGVYSYHYDGLPAGCSSANTSMLNCTPSTAGSYQVNVILTDSRGVAASGSTWVNVTAPSGGSLLGGPVTLGLAIGIPILVVAAVALLLIRRRRRNAPPTEEAVEYAPDEVTEP
jgi:hypothetical protein